MLLKEVAKTSLELAKPLFKQLEATESPLTMEDLLVRLEENEHLMESLEVESTAMGKGWSAKTSDKKGKQSMANPAIQQQPKCTSCGSEHDVSQCPKEKARLQKEAKQRGEKLQGPERSSRRGNQQPDQRQTAEAGDDKTRFNSPHPPKGAQQ